MVVTKALSTGNGNYRTYTGTAQEVIDALDTDLGPMSCVISIFWDSDADKVVAVCHK